MITQSSHICKQNTIMWWLRDNSYVTQPEWGAGLGPFFPTSRVPFFSGKFLRDPWSRKKRNPWSRKKRTQTCPSLWLCHVWIVTQSSHDCILLANVWWLSNHCRIIIWSRLDVIKKDGLSFAASIYLYKALPSWLRSGFEEGNVCFRKQRKTSKLGKFDESLSQSAFSDLTVNLLLKHKKLRRKTKMRNGK
jgi:hypothetical protein